MKKKYDYLSSKPIFKNVTLKTNVFIENKWADLKDHSTITWINLLFDIDIRQKLLNLSFVILNFEVSLSIEVE